MKEINTKTSVMEAELQEAILDHFDSCNFLANEIYHTHEYRKPNLPGEVSTGTFQMLPGCSS